MSHLYVIGNGFDLHHNMKTQYTDFRNWLEAEDEPALNTIMELFGEGDVEWWKDFEKNLANAITSDIVQNELIEHYPDFGSEDFSDADWYAAEYAVENVLSDAYDEIRDAFNQWVEQIEKGDENRKIRIETEDAIFLTFNYTATLEDLYGIDENKILHIHGKACTGDELVLGHGASEDEIEQIVERENPEDEEGDDLVVQQAKFAAIHGVYNQRKKVSEIINKYEDWFTALEDVTTIHFYGHSFCDVDIPYFEKTLSVVNRDNITIEVSDYENENREAIVAFMQNHGVRPDQYSIIDLEDIIEHVE